MIAKKLYKVVFGAIITCFIFMLARTTYLAVCSSEYFPIATVKIKASYKHISRYQLEQIVMPHAAKGFFGLSKRKLKTALQALAWAESIEITRVWPESLYVTIEEKVPFARWGSNKLLSTKGVLFSPEGKKWPDNLPELVGPDDYENQVLQEFKKMSNILHKVNLSVIKYKVNHHFSRQIVLKNGILLHLGRTSIYSRLNRLIDVYPQVLEKRAKEVAQVDLRYPHGMAVAFKPQSAVN